MTVLILCHSEASAHTGRGNPSFLLWTGVRAAVPRAWPPPAKFRPQHRAAASSAPTKRRDSCRNHPSQRRTAERLRRGREGWAGIGAKTIPKGGAPPRPPGQRLAKRKARKEQLVKFDLCPIPSECSTAQKVRKSDKSPARVHVEAASTEQNSLEPRPAARQGASRARNCAATSVFSFDGSTAVFFLPPQKENGGGLLSGIPGNPGFYFVKRLKNPVEVRKRISMTAGTM